MPFHRTPPANPPERGDTDRLVDVEQVAAYTSIAPSTLYSWRRVGRGPRSFKLHGRVVYRLSDVAAWLTAQEQATTPNPRPETPTPARVGPPVPAAGEGQH